MSRAEAIKIDVIVDTSQAEQHVLLHRFRNFGEDLWRHFRDERRVSIDLKTIDRCVDRFRFGAKNPTVARRAVKVARDMLAEHNLTGSVTIVD